MRCRSLVFGVIDFSVVVGPEDILLEKFNHIIVVMDHSFGLLGFTAAKIGNGCAETWHCWVIAICRAAAICRAVALRQPYDAAALHL